MVTIMMGLPRSGKTSWADKYCPHTTRVSADHYFETKEGYRFDAQHLHAAHEACFRQFISLVMSNEDVVVDNTGITRWERAPYILGGNAYDDSVEIVWLTADAETCISRPDNGHHVPETIIWRIASRLEKPLWGGASVRMVGVEGK